MAITIKQYPQAMMPVYNPIVVTVDSTNKSQCAFRYLCDIYADGVFIKQLTLFPTGADGYAEFHAERVLQDLLSFDLNENLYGSSLFADNPNSYLGFDLKFGEEYDSSAQCDAGTTVYSNLATFSGRCFNGVLQDDEWLDWTYTDYEALTPSTSQLSKFLTNTPDEVLIKYGDQMVFNIFSAPGLVNFLEVKTYTQAGALIGTYTFTNSISAAAIEVLSVGVGPENLNNSTLATGVQPVITSLVSYYTVQLFATGPIPASEVRTITIDKRDVKWDPHRLWWHSPLGGFDSYTFTLKDKLQTNISRTEFNRIFGGYRDLSPGTTWDYKKRDRGRTTLDVNAQDGMVYESNWLTEPEALWMKELFTTLELFEISTNPVVCFGSYTNTGSPDNTNLNVGEVGVGVEVGAVINIDAPGEDTLNGEFTVVEVGETTIGIGNPTGTGAGTNTLSGQFLLTDYTAILTPLILKSSSFETKTKNKVKNINYAIELDKAHAINRQRN